VATTVRNLKRSGIWPEIGPSALYLGSCGFPTNPLQSHSLVWDSICMQVPCKLKGFWPGQFLHVGSSWFYLVVLASFFMWVPSDSWAFRDGDKC
jgi:hypothetical protein